MAGEDVAIEYDVVAGDTRRGEPAVVIRIGSASAPRSESEPPSMFSRMRAFGRQQSSWPESST
jgi:hypothetical protein